MRTYHFYYLSLSSDEDGDDIDYGASDHDSGDDAGNDDNNSNDDNSEENENTTAVDMAIQRNRKVFQWRKKDVSPSDESFTQ